MKKFAQQQQGDDVVRSLPKQKQKSAWITGAFIIGSAVVGAGATAYGANKQEAANKKALAQNRSQFDSQQLQNWNSYLAQRGINPSGNTTVGGYGSGAPINTRLPLWAQATTGGRRLVPIGTPQATPTLAVQAPATY